MDDNTANAIGGICCTAFLCTLVVCATILIHGCFAK